MLKAHIVTFVTALSLAFSSAVYADTKVELATNLGNIVVELDRKNAPISTENFINYVKDGFYNDTIFHRVIPQFMIQGGGFTEDMQIKPTRSPIKNEANNQLKNDRGTIAMARTSDVNSATSQFFINVVNNDFLNYQSPEKYGYAVFGKVIEGMDVVDKIVKQSTQHVGTHQNVPKEKIMIIKATLLAE